MEEFGSDRHDCWAYATPEDKWQKVIPHIKARLLAKERVIYATYDSSVAEVSTMLVRSDKQVFETALAGGDLVIMSAKDLYYPNSEFDPEVTFKVIDLAEQEALAKGYTGLQGYGEMMWMFEDLGGEDQLIEYEQKISERYRDHKIKLMCLYNKSRFGPEMIHLMERIHHPGLHK